MVASKYSADILISKCCMNL